MPGYVKRPVEDIVRKCLEAARFAYWLDSYGVDSEHDYDPVWAKCVELKVAADVPFARHRVGQFHHHDQLHVQPYRPFCGGR